MLLIKHCISFKFLMKCFFFFLCRFLLLIIIKKLMTLFCLIIWLLPIKKVDTFFTQKGYVWIRLDTFCILRDTELCIFPYLFRISQYTFCILKTWKKRILRDTG